MATGALLAATLVSVATVSTATPAAAVVATPTVRVADLVVGESDGQIGIAVRLNDAADHATSVRVLTSSGSATGNVDYIHVDQTVTFNAGETLKTVPVQITDDVVDEGQESFFVGLGNLTGLTAEQPTGQVTIVDDDATTGTPSVFVRDVVVDETAGTASVPVVLGGGPSGGSLDGRAGTGTVAVTYTTADAGASAGSDYTTTAGTLTFSAGDTVKTVSIPIADDLAAEGAERIAVNLSGPTGGAVLADGAGVVTIVANDGGVAATPTVSVPDLVVGESDGYVDIPVTLNAPADHATSVRVLSSSGSATGNTDYLHVDETVTFNATQTVKTVRVELTDDAIDERQESFFVGLGNLSGLTAEQPTGGVTIVDDDVTTGTPPVFVRDVLVDETAGTALVPVVLGAGLDGAASSSTVTVAYTTADAGATAGSDYVSSSGTLSFAPGETVKTVVVDITDDLAAESVERIAVNLSGPTGGAVLADGAGVVTIVANDGGVAATPTVSVPDLVVGESDGYVDIPVTLNAPADHATSVRVLSSSGSATGNTDYLHVDETVTFNATQTVKTVRVELTDDVVDEGQESFLVGLGNLSGLAAGHTSGTITIVDNDDGASAPGVLGTITDSVTGGPVAGAWVAALRTTDFSLAAGAVADAAGGYSMPVAAGDYFLYLIDRTGTHTPGFLAVSNAVTVRVRPGALTHTDGVMAPTTGAITGTVRQTSPVAAVAGAWAIVSTAAGTPERAVVANASGSYAIGGLRTGNHVMVFVDPTGAHAPRYFPSSPTFPGATPTAVTAGGSATANGSLPSQAAVGTGALLTGTVTETGTGVPLAGVHVVALRASDFSIVRGAVTNASGAYSLNVIAGAYKLGFIDGTGLHAMEWHNNQPGAGLGSATSVTAPAVTNADLDRSTGSLSGTVTEDPSGGAMAGVWVLAIGPSGIAGGAVTAADGTYSVTGLAPGTYRVEFVDPTGARRLEFWNNAVDFSSANTVNVTAGGQVTAINGALAPA